MRGYMKILCLIFITAFFLALPHLSRAAYICGADLNGDGTTDGKGELQDCWPATDGINYLCPIQTGGCMAAYSNPICSDGGVLNPATDQCELSGGVTCAAGYSYDQTSNLCLATAVCQGSGTLDTANDVCRYNITCPTGYTFNSTYQGCVKAPSCPTGGTYANNVSTSHGWVTADRCVANPVITCLPGYTWSTYWNGSATVYGCVKNACPANASGLTPNVNSPYGHICTSIYYTRSCPYGYSLVYDGWWYEDYVCSAPKTYCDSGNYNSTTQQCEQDVTVVIPEGYVQDPATGAYIGDPACPAGMAYNTATDLCESIPITTQCPDGYAVNAPSTGCEALKCPDGTWSCGIYNDSYLEKCTASAIIDCQPGLTFQGGYCATNPTCDTNASYDPSLNKCKYDTAYSCPAGYTYNATVGRCQMDPVCPTGMVYDAALDRCATLTQMNGICPLGSYPCDTGGACTKTYPCDTGFQTMDICMQNCDVACTSFCNTDAIAALGDVFWTGQAASWFGITGVTGSNDQLIFYGKDASYSDIEVGRITMNGCNFSGSASYFTPSGDACSSTSWGLSGVSATGSQITFLGGECGSNAGSITVSNCYIDIPASSTNYDITHVVGSGTSLTFFGGFSGNQQLISLSLCQYSYKCPTCQVTRACLYECPDPSYTLLADFRCATYATCPSGGSLSAQLDKCETVAIVDCPLGYTFDAPSNSCVKAPFCPTGTSLDPNTDRCVTTNGISCPDRPAGYPVYTYNPAISSCVVEVQTDALNLICPGNTAGSTIAPPNFCSSDRCDAPFLSATCPTNSQLNTSTGRCEAAPTGYGTLDTVLDKFIYYAVTTCPTGWTQSGAKCVKNPICPPNGSWDPYINACKENVVYTCPSGFTWNTAFNTCVADVLCSGADQLSPNWPPKCVNPSYQVSCPANYSYDSTLEKCATAAVCSIGALDPAIDLCKVSDSSILCPSGYSINFTRGQCESTPSCLPPGAYSATLDKCSDQPNYSCPVGYAFVGGNCYRLPDCPNGTYQAATDNCYDGITQCSIGNYPCYSYNGEVLCSPYTCVDQTNPTVTNTAQSNLASPTNNGTVDQNGDCSGQFYTMSGTAGECRTSGTQTMFKNCCNTANAMNPIFCDAEKEAPVAQKVAQEMCHYVGTYCAEEWALLGCVQSKKVYCCFESKLARIINEQGRGQLQSFQPDMWGTPQAPKCRGFTPEEFQMLDFSKIDLSEFFSDIRSNLPLPQDVRQGAEQKIYDFYNKIK